MIGHIITVIALVFLILFSSFFSSAETSFLSVSSLMLRQMKKQNKKNVSLIAKLKDNIDILLSTILVGNNFVNTLSSSLATALAVSLFGDKGIGIATFFMTIIIITFGEILPKTAAANNPFKFAQRYAKPLFFLEKILYPIVSLFSLISAGVNKIIRKIWTKEAPILTEEELKTIIALGSKDGLLETSEENMIYKIFNFNDLRVHDVMKNRRKVKTVRVDFTYEQVLAVFKSTGFSRLPVFKKSFDDVCGILHYKDVLFFEETETFNVEKVMREPLFVPETQETIPLIQLFRSKHQNMAIVVDEHGSNCGLVTMDDLLKIVFGHVTDEYSSKNKKPEDKIKIVSPNEFLVPSSLNISDANQFFKLDLDSDFYHTLGGWLLEQFGYLPSNDETFSYKNVQFVVEEQNNRRIQLIRIRYPNDRLK